MSHPRLDNNSPSQPMTIPDDIVEYIRQFCPATYKKLRELVNQGKIAIAGGKT